MGGKLILILLLVGLFGCGDASWRNPDGGVKTLQQPGDDVALTLSTYNLKFFGTGGGFYKRHEHREQYLKSFILQELATSDIVVFTEVVDVNRLREMVRERWACDGYDRSHDPEQQWHQHITICYSPAKYRVEKYDEDWVIPEHALGSRFLRPALQARVCHAAGDCFLQVVGVHLKAGQETDRRIAQVNALKDELSKQAQPLPTVIVGDFNSYRKEQSGKDQHDMTYFEEILTASGQNYRSLTWGVPTYGSGNFGRNYDHIVASQQIAASAVRAYPACGAINEPTSDTLPYDKLAQWYSDHCYLTAKLIIQ